MNIIKKSRAPLAPVWGENRFQKKLPSTKTHLTLRLNSRSLLWAADSYVQLPSGTLPWVPQDHHVQNLILYSYALSLKCSLSQCHHTTQVTKPDSLELSHYPSLISTCYIHPSSLHLISIIFVESLSFSISTTTLLVEGLKLSGVGRLLTWSSWVSSLAFLLPSQWIPPTTISHINSALQIWSFFFKSHDFSCSAQVQQVPP